jgi:hypothetical protein
MSPSPGVDPHSSEVAAAGCDHPVVGRSWRLLGWLATLCSAALIIGFTIVNVGPNGVGTAIGTCLVGLVPVAICCTLPLGTSRVFELLMIALLAGYTGYWIFATFDYGHYMLGGLYFVVLPVYGVFFLGLPIALYWLLHEGRIWLRGAARVDEPGQRRLG